MIKIVYINSIELEFNVRLKLFILVPIPILYKIIQ